MSKITQTDIEHGIHYGFISLAKPGTYQEYNSIHQARNAYAHGEQVFTLLGGAVYEVRKNTFLCDFPEFSYGFLVKPEPEPRPEPESDNRVYVIERQHCSDNYTRYFRPRFGGTYPHIHRQNPWVAFKDASKYKSWKIANSVLQAYLTRRDKRIASGVKFFPAHYSKNDFQVVGINLSDTQIDTAQEAKQLKTAQANLKMLRDAVIGTWPDWKKDLNYNKEYTVLRVALIKTE
jgi:hypothetical protein